MKFIADLHIHSHFSRATSKSLDPENLHLWAQKKGIAVVGTGDFTHPGWVNELQDKLIEAENGLYRLRPDLKKLVDSKIPSTCVSPTRFLLSAEISCIYKKNGKTRKVHHLILMPDMDSVLKLNKQLDRIGNITSDGRPILGLDSRDLLEITLEASDRAFFIPAHIWTPWFSVFGSKSGFDTLNECFEDLTNHIYALETGLSSDPPMNRLLSTLDGYLLISNSDAHSPGKLGREANVFDTDLDYNHMTQAMTSGDGFVGTIEFYPEEGKYHLDGHRKCQVRLKPAETNKKSGICPVCGKKLTVGVLHRICDLADRDIPELSKDYFSLIPLPEMLSEVLNCGPATKKVMSAYEKLLFELGPELRILMDIPVEDIEAAGGPVVAEAIKRMRQNQVIREEGYDGEYGKILLFSRFEKQAASGQMALFAQKRKKSSISHDQAPGRRKAFEKKRESKTPEPVSPKDPVLDPLNLEQKSAVINQGGHLLVVAGPGTGKTMTLTHRIAYLIRSRLARPEQMLALTFTRKAAREMEQRIGQLLQGFPGKGVQVSTFHSFCLDILRNEKDRANIPPDFTLLTEIDARYLVQEVFAESGAAKRSMGKFLKTISNMKMMSVVDPSNLQGDRELISVFGEYQSRLRELGLLDYDDLEVETLRLFHDYPEVSRFYAEKFPWIFVDEYQDTSTIQFELLNSLIHAGPVEICAIGDPDQSIYGFRGSDVRIFFRFAEDFPGARVITLTRNYRSTESILKCSASVMGKAKALEYGSGKGMPIAFASCRTESEEAEMVVEQIERLIGGTSYFSLDSGRVASHEGELSVGFGDIGVLFRLNAQGDALEEALNRAGIPLVRSGETSLIGRYPVNILWSFFQVLKNPGNPFYAKMYDSLLSDDGRKRKEMTKSFETGGSLKDLIDRTVEAHDFDCLSEESLDGLDRLRNLSVNFEGNIQAFLDTLSLERGIDHEILAGDRVALMSIHAAKGLEWPVVFITGCEDQLIPCSLFGSMDGEEERRIFYVGLTRACSWLFLSHVKRRALNGRVIKMKPSPFLKDIPENLCKPLDRRGWKPKGKPHKQLDLFK